MHPFEAIKISNNIYWVGAIDWDLRSFHGYATERGTTYNAYLIMGEKPILIDTVKAPFFSEMMSRIASVIEPEKIKYIISNHAEMDHSGSLLQTIAALKPEKVFASKAGVQALKDHFHSIGEITEVKDGEELNLGNIKLKFIETKMLHWPDSMFTYCVNDKVLFSQDGFGMHLAVSDLFVEQNNFGIVEREAAKYFANILLPYSSFVTSLIEKFPTLNLDVQIIAPDHGPLWRGEKIKWIMDSWARWAKQNYYAKAVIVYDTMWGSTAKMAEAIADGLMAENIAVKVLQSTVTARSDVITEMLEAGAFLVGSPTLNQEIFPTIADHLCYIRGLKPKNFVGQIFGSYGWAGEAQKILTDELQKIGVELVGDGIKVKYVPTEEALVQCRNLGIQVARALKSKLSA